MCSKSANIKRIRFIDNAKSIGLILVVLGHSVLATNIVTLHQVIYSFHMPLFFFISGLLHKDFALSLGGIRLKASKLLLPFYFTALLYATVKCIIDLDHFMGYEWKPFIHGVLWGTGGRGSVDRYLFWPPLWFFTSLFVTQVGYVLMRKHLLAYLSMCWRVVVVTIILCFGIYLLVTAGKQYLIIGNMRIIVADNGFFYNLDLLPVTLFYYWLGVELQFIKKKTSTKNDQYLVLIIFWLAIFLFATLSICRAYEVGGEQHWAVMDLNYRNYGNIVVSTIMAISGIVIVLNVSKYLNIKTMDILAKFASYGVVIIAFHYVFQHNASSILGHSTLGAVIGIVLGIVGPVILAELVIKRIPLLASIYNIS